MSRVLAPSRAASQLATRIENDIRSRGLSSGDRYLTAKEVAKSMGVSTATCHVAMRLLAERDVLRRRQNSGTFVGPSVAPQQSALMRAIYILLSEDRRLGTLPYDTVMNGLWRELPGIGLYFVVLPAGNEVRYVEDLLSKLSDSSPLLGVVAVSCPREVYSFLTLQNIPVVVMGSVDPADDRLASVDGDELQAGSLLSHHMLKQGYRRFTVLLGEVWRPGDNRFLEGVQNALQEANLPVGAMKVRGLPNEARMFKQQVRPLLAECSEPTAFICQNEGFVPWLDELRLAEPLLNWSQIGIAYHVDMEMPERPLDRYPCTYQTVPAIEMSAIVGKMLAQLSSGEELPQRHVFLPIALRDPENRENRG